MAHVIAVAGKGGVGKTTLSGLIVQYLSRKGKTPILAVDADANSNLNEVLGIEAERSLGEIREEITQAETNPDNPIPKGMTKAEYAEFMFQKCLAEEDDYDMLIMGRSQGRGCYCFVNGLLQSQLQKLTPHYKYLVVDNEAGMEHISRGLLPKIDTFILVSDCSRRGVQAVGRIAELIRECNIIPQTIGLIVNRAPEGKLNAGTMEEIEKQGLTLFGIIPQDNEVYEYDCDGKPMVDLPDQSPVRQALYGILDRILEMK